MIALGYYGAEVYDISMPFPTGPLGFAKSRATIRENPGKIGVLGATKRAEVELSSTSAHFVVPSNHCTFPEVGHLVRRPGRWWALQMRRLSPHAVVGYGHRVMRRRAVDGVAMAACIARRLDH